MSLEARMACEPASDMALLAGGAVVRNGMDIQLLGGAAGAGAQEAQACGATRAALAEDQALEHMESAEPPFAGKLAY